MAKRYLDRIKTVTLEFISEEGAKNYKSIDDILKKMGYSSRNRFSFKEGESQHFKYEETHSYLGKNLEDIKESINSRFPNMSAKIANGRNSDPVDEFYYDYSKLVIQEVVKVV